MGLGPYFVVDARPRLKDQTAPISDTSINTATNEHTMIVPIQAPIEQFELPHPSGDGAFKISVWKPDSIAEGRSDLPVIFVLDADMEFALAAEIARLRGAGGFSPTAMVVGIGYGVAFAEFAKMRTADLTPPLSDEGRRTVGKMANLIGDDDGGAERFLTFLVEELAPEIARRYPSASKTDHILYGHSLGGLFVLFALLTRPEAFSTFLAVSPSIWWDGFAVLNGLPDFAERRGHLTRQPRVFVAVGAKEQDLPLTVPAGLDMPLSEVQALVVHCRMVDAAAEFAASLRQSGVAEVAFAAFEGEDHGSVVPTALTRGLGFAIPASS